MFGRTTFLRKKSVTHHLYIILRLKRNNANKNNQKQYGNDETFFFAKIRNFIQKS